MEAINEIWVECNMCEETITSIEAITFDGKCQACYLGISKQTAKEGTGYFTLLSIRSVIESGVRMVEVTAAFPLIGAVELLVGYGHDCMEVVKLNSNLSIMNKIHIMNIVDELVYRCVDFSEVAETLRVNSVG